MAHFVVRVLVPIMLVVLVGVGEATPPGIAKNPSHATCRIKKYKHCYNLVHVCPKFCPDQCTVECASCKPICVGASNPPPSDSPTPSTPDHNPPPSSPIPSTPDHNPPPSSPTPSTPEHNPPPSSPSPSTPENPPPSSPTPSKPENPPPSSPTPTPDHNPPPSSPTPSTPENPPPSSPTPTPDHNPPPSSPTPSTPENPPPSSPTPSTPDHNPPPSSPTPSTPENTPPSSPTPSTPDQNPPPSSPSTPKNPPPSSPTIPSTPERPPSSSPPPSSSTPDQNPPPSSPSTPSTPKNPPTSSPTTPSTPERPPSSSPPPSSPTPSTPENPPPSPSTPSPTPKTARCRNKYYPKCYNMEHVCPSPCPTGCEVDCVTCKPVCKCDRPGAVCQDPRFIGGDGVTFYFHGKKDSNFCLVSEPNLHINAHFIGRRNPTMTRDFTWVQSLAILFHNHRIFVGALETGKWDDSVDRLSLIFDGKPITLHQHEDAAWNSITTPRVIISRAADVNSVIIEVLGRLRITAKVVPITEEDSRIHNYGITNEDCFAHLDLGFKFFSLSNEVSGVLGQTYRPDYVSNVDIKAKMPIMGGEKRFETTSLFAPDCSVARFVGKDNGFEFNSGAAIEGLELPSLSCASGMDGLGVVCKR